MMTHSKHLERRTIEAEMLGRVYRNLCEEIGAERALQVVARTVEQAARDEGASFALEADPNPSLAHFETIREAWGDSMELQEVERQPGHFRFDVTRCRYIECYQALGLPRELIGLLSCARDAPFAGAYSARLSFSRTQTLADGGNCCDFHYRWRLEDG